MKLGRTDAAGRAGNRIGFTLVELLVVMLVTAVLIALLLSAVGGVLNRGRSAACVSNLRQLSAGINMYASEHDGELPFGPKAAGFGMGGNLYTSTGAPTSLITLTSGAPVGLGLILPYLKDPRIFFCPGCDQSVDTTKELSKVGKKQVQSSYYYRHGSNPKITDIGGNGIAAPRLASLGENRRGKPIRALVMDSQFICAPGLKGFGVVTRTHHKALFTNVLYVDGSVTTFPNDKAEFNVDITGGGNAYESFDIILKAFELVDGGAIDPIESTAASATQ